LGIKPLYVAREAGRLRFASTLPALTADGDVDTSIDPVALHHYMTFHSAVPAPLTIKGVRKFPLATLRVVKPDGRETDRVYWQPSFVRPETAWSASEWQERVLDKLRLAVQRCMVADVPVGVLLSGGLDSSLVVALLAESGQRELMTLVSGSKPRAVKAATSFCIRTSWRGRSKPTTGRSASMTRGFCPPWTAPSTT
jgi:asparagine synthase (glutamine-hydrolysing)